MSTLSIFLQTIGILASSQNLTSEEELLKELLRYPPEIDCHLPLTTLRFVVLDTETTGLKPQKGDKIISLGAVVLENGSIKEEDTFYQLVNPGRHVPDTITKLTSITDQMLQDKPPLTDVLARFLVWAGSSILVGHAVHFDFAFINNHLLRTFGKKLRHKSLDTKNLASYLFPNLSNFSLEELCSYLDIPCEQRHHALGDAITAARLLETFIQRLSSLGVRTLDDLDNFIRYRRLLKHSSTPSGG
ncbi:MAG: 3'-5' exoribonuclease [Thermoanaerobacteraceae bacterium]|nr:3'-5' exoribonuclease [Thermoanaerobacteraceae bacterium]